MRPRGLLLSRDKPLCKQLLAYHRIPTPQFAVLRRGIKFRVPSRLRYPLFVKSATEDASLGIAQASVIQDPQQLRDRVAFIHDQVGTDALVEEGRHDPEEVADLVVSFCLRGIGARSD